MSMIIDGSNGLTYPDTSTQSSTSIGYSPQTCQNLTASRSSGVTYTNSTGRPIQVFVTKSGNGSGTVYINGTEVSYWVASSNDFPVMDCIVPNGATYQVAGGLGYWSELR